MDVNLEKMTMVAYYLSVSYHEIQHKTDVVLHQSMSYVLSQVHAGYQVTIALQHCDVKQLTAKKDKKFSILLTEDEFEQLVEKSRRHQQECSKKIDRFKMIQESELNILEEIFNKRLTFLKKFQQGYVPNDEKNKKSFIELLTTYPIAPEINQVVKGFSFYDNCSVTFEDKDKNYQVKAIDYNHLGYVAADFEISKKQFRALAKLEYVGLGHQSWIIERDLFANQMRDGSLYLNMKEVSCIPKIITQINAAYGSDASRTSGAGAHYIKINSQTSSGKQAIADILDALNMQEVPKHINNNNAKALKL